MILVYKFIRTEPNRLATMVGDPVEEPAVIPKLVGEYQDEAMAKNVIGTGHFAIYESVGKPDKDTGLYSSFKLVKPVVEVSTDTSISMRKKAKLKT